MTFWSRKFRWYASWQYLRKLSTILSSNCNSCPFHVKNSSALITRYRFVCFTLGSQIACYSSFSWKYNVDSCLFKLVISFTHYVRYIWGLIKNADYFLIVPCQDILQPCHAKIKLVYTYINYQIESSTTCQYQIT